MKVLTTTGLTKLIQLSKDTFVDKTNTVDISTILPTVDQTYNASSTNAQSGTAVASAISTKQATITGAATTITSSNLTANRALISNGSGKVAVSTTTSTELGYVNGVTSAIQTQFNTITNKIPSAATSSNQLADKAFVNSSINAVAAYYVTADATGNAFATKAALDTGPYYHDGTARTPTENDYAIVSADETHDNACTRYSYTGSQWSFQYIVNDTPFTQAQINAINSGITSTLVSNYSTHIADTDIHVTTSDKNTWNGKQAAITGGASTITSSNLTASRALVSNSSGKVAVSSVTSTELGYVSGVTSAIQTQLNNKVASNTAITGATKCKITYDSKGLVTAGANLAASDIPNLASSKTTAMTGYSIASSAAAISTSDSLNIAIGKLEYKIDNIDALPSQTGQSGKYLATDGTEASWMTVVTYDSTNKRLVFA